MQPLLYVNAKEGCPPVDVYFNGKLDRDGQWTEIDVLGCWGRRYVYNDDGSPMVRDDCLVTEKVYGQFELRRR